MDGCAPIAARTLDISANGISLLMNEPLQTGQRCQISFEMYFDGKANVVTAKAAVSHCIFSSTGFKVGFQFSKLDLSAMTVIAKFIR